MVIEEQGEKCISDIVGVFADTVIVFPGGWGDSLPDWLKSAITMERLMMNVESLKTGQMIGTDAEACAYLMTVSLTQPMDSNWSQIYLYVAGKTCTKWQKNELPNDIRVNSLTEQQMNELNRLKGWLYSRRTSTRRDLIREEKRNHKNKEIAKNKMEQPELFEF